MARKGNRKEIYINNDELKLIKVVQRYYKADQTAAIHLTIIEGCYVILKRIKENPGIKVAPDLQKLLDELTL